MKLNATVNHKGALACFEIRSEAPGIYYADLIYYEGSKTECPPNEITLIQSVRHWTGSFNDKTLLNQLGEKIEETFVSPRYS